MKLELLTNATVVDKAIRFVSEKGEGRPSILSIIRQQITCNILRYIISSTASQYDKHRLLYLCHFKFTWME
jgi:hypothetical protein